MYSSITTGLSIQTLVLQLLFSLNVASNDVITDVATSILISPVITFDFTFVRVVSSGGCDISS